MKIRLVGAELIHAVRGRTDMEIFVTYAIAPKAVDRKE